MFKQFGSRAKALFLALALSLVGTTSAFAQTDSVGTVVKTAIDAAGPEVTMVIGSVATALVIIVAWKLIKKAMG